MQELPLGLTNALRICPIRETCERVRELVHGRIEQAVKLASEHGSSDRFECIPSCIRHVSLPGSSTYNPGKPPRQRS